jgi:hypothetical protein
LVGTLWTASETNDDSGQDIPLQETCQRRGEIYAPISVIYGEVRDLFMKVFRNVGLFIQVSVGFSIGQIREKLWILPKHTSTSNSDITRSNKKREPVSRLPLAEIGLC